MGYVGYMHTWMYKSHTYLEKANGARYKQLVLYIKLLLPPISVPPCPLGKSPSRPSTNSL
jgi:hypothetical protein